MSNKIIKSVSFNIKNLNDQVLLKHLENVNFSGYVKDLIQADFQKRNQELKIIKKVEGGGLKIIVG